MGTTWGGSFLLTPWGAAWHITDGLRCCKVFLLHRGRVCWEWLHVGMADKTQQSQQMTSRAKEIFRVWASDDVVKSWKKLLEIFCWLDDSTGTIWSFGWGFIEVLIWFYSFFLVTKNLVRQIGLSHCDLPIVSWYHSLSSRVHFSDMPGNATVFSPMESKTVTVDIRFHAVLMRHFNIPEPRPWDLSWLETPQPDFQRNWCCWYWSWARSCTIWMDKVWMIVNSLQIHDLKAEMNLHPSNTSWLIVWFGWCWNGRIQLWRA